LTAAGRPVLSPASRLNLLGRDNGSGIALVGYALDSDIFGAYALPFAVGDAGLHTLRYRSSDNLGLVEEEHLVLFTVDSAPPVSSARLEYDTTNSSMRILLSAQDTGTGVAGTWFRIAREGAAAGDWQKGAVAKVSLSPDHSSDGKYAIEYYSADNLGNREQNRSLAFVVDTISRLVLNGKEAFTTGKDSRILSGSAEPGSKVTINGVPASVDMYANFSIEVGLKEGKNRLVVNATDPAGNTAERTIWGTYTIPGQAGLAGPQMIVLAAAIAAAGVAGLLLLRRMRREPKKPI
jgi:hypothetical protein